MEIENYSEKPELTIKQNFYSSIYIFNHARIVINNIQNIYNEKTIKNENKEYRTKINTLGRIKNRLLDLFTTGIEKIKKILERIITHGVKYAYLYDFNRSKKQWYDKIFVGKFRFNQRINI